MSLVRLLTAGKSLVGLKDGQVHYRMSDPRAMPKFGSSRNPFQAKASEEVRETPAEPPVGRSGGVRGGSLVRAKTGLVVEGAGSSRSVSAEEQMAATGVGPCESQRVSGVFGLDNSDSLRKSDALRLPGPESERAVLPAAASARLDPSVPQGAPAVPQSLLSKAAKPAAGLKEWVVSLKGLLGGPLSPGRKPGPARSVPRAMQTELSLDNIKVLRNDLSDADLVVVTSKPPSAETRSAPAKGAVEHAVPSETAWERVATLFGADRS